MGALLADDARIPADQPSRSSRPAAWMSAVMVMPTEWRSRRDFAVSQSRNWYVPPLESARTSAPRHP
jgi:hypothetical protein